MPLNPVYAETREQDGGWRFGFDFEDFELIRLGYACPHCLEIFNEGGMPIALTTCSVCRQPTALGDIERAIDKTPEDWLAYQRHRKEVLDAPPERH